MAEGCTIVSDEAPPSKLCRLKMPSTEEEIDLPDEIFPSEDESDTIDNTGSYDVFFPSRVEFRHSSRMS